MAPHMKISRIWGEHMFIYRVSYAESHGPHENSTGLKHWWVMHEKAFFQKSKKNKENQQIRNFGRPRGLNNPFFPHHIVEGLLNSRRRVSDRPSWILIFKIPARKSTHVVVVVVGFFFVPRTRRGSTGSRYNMDLVRTWIGLQIGPMKL